MHFRHRHLAAAIAAALAAPSVAWATRYEATLNGVISYSNNGSAAGNIGSSTATWAYDDATDTLGQAGGVFDVRFTITPTTTLFRHSITGLTIGSGAAAIASTFVCTEGNFGAGVGASICGNYRFGVNGINESNVTWGPGVAFSRTLGGDDTGIPPPPVPPAQNITAYDGFTTRSLAGTTLLVGNSRCVSSVLVDCSLNPEVSNAGYDWSLTLADASRDSAATASNTPTDPIDVLANDPGVGDPVTVGILVPPDQGGTVTIINQGADCADPCTGPRADIRLVLTPSAPSGSGAYTETFTYQVSDGVNAASAEVSVQVAAAPGGGDGDAPGELPGGSAALDLSALALLAAARRRARHRG